jgi:hypothetical protein
MGIKEIADIIPNNVDEPVWLRRYNGNAKRKIRLPKSDMICPMDIRIKSLDNIDFVVFILDLLVYNTYCFLVNITYYT